MRPYKVASLPELTAPPLPLDSMGVSGTERATKQTHKQTLKLNLVIRWSSLQRPQECTTLQFPQSILNILTLSLSHVPPNITSTASHANKLTPLDNFNSQYKSMFWLLLQSIYLSIYLSIYIYNIYLYIYIYTVYIGCWNCYYYYFSQEWLNHRMNPFH